MVKYAMTALVATLVSTATAEHHRFGRRGHLHPRSYPVAPAPSYSTVPEASESVSSAYSSVPAASESVSLPYNTVPVPSGPATVPSGLSSSAPYGFGNGTTYGPTGTGASTTPDVVISTATVIPIPETTPGAGGSSVPGNGGYPTGGVPAGSVPAASGSGAGSPPAGSTGGAGGECGPETVTVTAPGSTVTVTAGASSSAIVPPAGPSSVPAGQQSESAGASYPVVPASSVEQPSAPGASSSVYSAPAVSSAPAASGSESASAPAYTPVPETTAEVQTTPVAASSSVAVSSVASSSAPAASSSSYSTSGSKRGIVYTEASNLSDLQKQSDKCGWSWNWNGNDFGVNAPWDYVPILNNKDQAPSFAGQAKTAISAAPAGSKYVMGPNEPDQDGEGGSGMTVGEAVDYYSKYIAPMKDTGAKLGSISVTSDQSGVLNALGQPKGLPFLEAWKKECDNQGEGTCPVDFVCVHWYGPDKTLGIDGATQGKDFVSYIKNQVIPKVDELFGSDMPIWVSEFGASPQLNEDTEATFNAPFMKTAIPYLEGESRVSRYAYFMAAPGYLIDDSGALTAGGKAYLDA